MSNHLRNSNYISESVDRIKIIINTIKIEILYENNLLQGSMLVQDSNLNMNI